MKGKIALITGAKGGLGTAVTEAFLSAGATVAGTSRSIKQSDFPQSNFVALPADLTDAAATRELVQFIIQRFGKIDVLVHVAGGFAAAPIHLTSDEMWNRLRDLNTTSAFHIAREVVLAMRASGGGRIIAIGSLAAMDPHPGLGAYMASKSAMAAIFRTIAIENFDAGITSNLIMPDTMDTPTNRAEMPNANPSKWVKPQDVAKITLALARDESKINGAIIPVYAAA
jgi:NAD(P)-dependent dehydrogenase (short-subunit alcohol dehydrogenase family)